MSWVSFGLGVWVGASVVLAAWFVRWLVEPVGRRRRW